MNCFGDANQQKIVKENDLEIISHVILLPGQQKTGCASRNLTNEYYLVKYKNIKTGYSSTFLAGKGSIKGSKESSKGLEYYENQKRLNNGKELINIPRCFDPLQHAIAGGTGTGGTAIQNQIDSCNKEILTIIQLLVCLWNIQDIKGDLFPLIQNEIFTNPNVRIKYQYIKAINTLVSKDSIIKDIEYPNIVNLQDLLNYYRTRPNNPWNFRIFDFSCLRDELNKGLTNNWDGIVNNYIQV